MSPGPRTGREKNTDKTTKLLSAILLLFIVAELPQVLFNLYYAVYKQQKEGNKIPLTLNEVSEKIKDWAWSTKLEGDCEEE